jgi:plastocyanin
MTSRTAARRGSLAPRGPAALRLALATLLAVLLAVLLAACGDDDAGESSDGTGLGGAGGGADEAEAPDDVVVIDDDRTDVAALDNSFRPEDIQVRPGTTVVWTNRGRNDHDVLPTEGDAWGVEVADFTPGDVYSATFDEPGTYDYYCSIHGTKTAGMIGTVVVAE